MSQTFHVNEFVDGQRIRAFNIRLLVWSFLAMFCDGFDLNSMGFAAPLLSQFWGIERSAMGPVLSANLVGIFIGAPLLGWVGDRYGRRPVIVAASFFYGILTLAMAMTTTVEQMMVLRFFAGIGLGGIMPNTISLNSELSPKRFRSTLVILMFMGITMGSTGVGLVDYFFIESYGWRIIFISGGILPILVALCLFFVLPESLKLLATKPQRQAELVRTARAMRPDLEIAGDAVFVNPPILASSKGSILELFRGSLALITPLLWISFCIALMANFFLNNLIPLVFDNYGIPPREAALVATWYHAGGTFGGLLISFLLDRLGFSIIAVMFALAIPFIAMLGFNSDSFFLLACASALSGVTILGAQFGNNAAAGLLYPTSIRAKGVGVALSVGRFGSIIGPTAGALLLGMNLEMQQVFMLAAVPVLLGLVAAILLTVLCYRRFNSFLIDDTPAAGQDA